MSVHPASECADVAFFFAALCFFLVSYVSAEGSFGEVRGERQILVTNVGTHCTEAVGTHIPCPYIGLTLGARHNEGSASVGAKVAPFAANYEYVLIQI